MESYFKRISDSSFLPSEHVGGSWNTSEQHVAPPMGLLAHALEKNHRERGGKLQLLSINYDILGVLPLEAVEVSVRVIRPGRTIELLEGVLSHAGRPALIARAWFLAEGQTTAVAGTHFSALAGRNEMDPWVPSSKWPGAYIKTLEAFQNTQAPGRAQTWAKTTLPLVESEPVSSTATALTLIDLANGTAPRVEPGEAFYPNLDLKVSFLREPASPWLGFDTSVTFNDNGFGLTHTILHDESGFLGTVSQALTVRLPN